MAAGRHRGDADGNGQMTGDLRVERYRHRCNFLADAVCQLGRFFGRLLPAGNMASSSPPKRGGGIHAANLRLHPMCDLFQCVVAGQVPVAIVDAFESVDVDHQAGNRTTAPLRSRQFFFQALLQVAAVVPAGKEGRLFPPATGASD